MCWFIQRLGNPNLARGNKSGNVLAGGTLARLGHADSRFDLTYALNMLEMVVTNPKYIYIFPPISPCSCGIGHITLAVYGLNND